MSTDFEPTEYRRQKGEHTYIVYAAHKQDGWHLTRHPTGRRIPPLTEAMTTSGWIPVMKDPIYKVYETLDLIKHELAIADL